MNSWLLTLMACPRQACKGLTSPPDATHPPLPQQAKQPLQQQNAFAAAAAHAAAEAVTAAETSYVEKLANLAGVPASIDSSQLRAATQGVTANLRRVADLNRTQEQSTRRQARATAVAPLPAPSSSTVDLTGDAD